MDKPAKPAKKEVKAFARYIHVSPQKLRLLADMIRKSPVDQALQQLKFSSKSATKPLVKAINSAVANAVHNFDMNKDNLFIKSLTIDMGPVFKRYAPRAQGRAFVVRKRTSHINVVLEERQAQARKQKRSIFARSAAAVKPETESKPKGVEKEAGKTPVAEKLRAKQAPKSDEKMKTQKISLKRRLFNRKSGS